MASIVVVMGLVSAASATAHAAGHHNNVNAGPLTLVARSISTNPNAPPWCLTEDDWRQDTYVGYLSGTYDTTVTLCGLPTDSYNGIWWDAGGIGLEADVYAVGALNDLTIAAPDGTVHHASLVGQTTAKGATTNHYAVCYVPPFSLTSNVGGTPLPGGTWHLDLSGALTGATWSVDAQMTDVPFQQAYCPAGQQNLAP